MKSKNLLVTLEEDVVLSRNSATLGGHQTLDCLPGSVFLGASAARLYNRDIFNLEASYRVFQSGQVRFGNGLPINSDGYVGYPVPFCWFAEKNKQDVEIRHTINAIYNKDIISQDHRFRQCREGYVPLAQGKIASLFSPVSSYQMKTAIHPDTGTAADHQLFGYSSLPAGSRFIFCLEADENIEDRLFMRLEETLLATNIQIGRSRSAEYGAVRIEPFNYEQNLTIGEDNKDIIIWLLSDAVLVNERGLPVTNPELKDLLWPILESAEHIQKVKDGWNLNLKKSFLQHRYYAPFNSKYGRRELERIVLNKGSVLCFSRSNSLEPDLAIFEWLRKVQSSGIGVYRQNGLGKIWVNPPILDYPPVFHHLPPAVHFNNSPPSIPKDDVVYQYLNHRLLMNKGQDIIQQLSNELISNLELLYKSAWQLYPHITSGCLGPSPTQWGRVMEAAKSAVARTDGNLDELKKILFENRDCICREHDPQWDTAVILAKGEKQFVETNFRKWLQQIMEETYSVEEKLLPDLFYLFARDAMDVSRRQSCFLPMEEE